MLEGMRADFRAVDALSQRLIERARVTKRIKCTTPSGTAAGPQQIQVSAKKEAQLQLFQLKLGINSGNDLLSRKLDKHYHRSYDVSLPCSGWERVGPPCKSHQRIGT